MVHTAYVSIVSIRARFVSAWRTSVKLLLMELLLKRFGLAAARTEPCGAVLEVMGRGRVARFMGFDETRLPPNRPCPHNRRAGRSAAAPGHDLPCISLEVRMDMEEPFSMIDRRQNGAMTDLLYNT